MRATISLGVSRFMLPLPAGIWRRLVARNATRARAACSTGLSPDHHRVRDFVVREVGRTGEAQPPEHIAAELGLGIHRLRELLAELERGMIYLYREGGENVVWAYPATAAETPHRLKLDTGARVHAA